MHKKKIVPLKTRAALSSPTLYGEELKYVTESYTANPIFTSEENRRQIEHITRQKTGGRYAAALSSGTAALHMAVRLAGIRMYGEPRIGHGVLEGRRVFCTDVTASASVNPILYEGGEPVFIDADRDCWNMDPEALRKAFELYPEVKIIVLAHFYGFPGKIDEIRKVADEHQAVIIEDAADALGAGFEKKPAGTWGEYGVFSFNSNKIITGFSGGMLVSPEKDEIDRVCKWSTQSRENALWCQHEELGYANRITEAAAGVIRGQYPYLEKHIEKKKEIYERYKSGFKGLPVQMNPITNGCTPNYWISCFMIDAAAMTLQVCRKTKVSYTVEPGKSCPAEIIGVLREMNAQGSPVWKPMHMQPVYGNGRVVTANGIKAGTDWISSSDQTISAGEEIFARGICLPSDIKMTGEQQERIIAEVRACFE